MRITDLNGYARDNAIDNAAVIINCALDTKLNRKDADLIVTLAYKMGLRFDESESIINIELIAMSGHRKMYRLKEEK